MCVGVGVCVCVCACVFACAHTHQHMAKRSKGDRSGEPWKWEVELILTLAASHPPQIHCCHSWKGGMGGRRDASCHERQCQGRREISRRHSVIVPVKYKHSAVGKTWYPSPLQPGSLTFRVSPTSSQYGLFHPVGGSKSSPPPFIYLLYHSQERNAITAIIFMELFMLEPYTQRSRFGPNS